MAEQQGQGFGLPGSPPRTVNLPQNTGFVSFEVFETMNTKPTRPAIKESEMFWCDGWMPFGPSNLRTLPGIGPLLYTAPGGTSITGFWFYNIGNTTYAAVMLSDGSMYQVNTSNGSTVQILTAGTLQNPNPNNVWTSQWNATYLIIVANQTNGYWLWDGVSPATQTFTAGTLSPTVVITNGGSNYTAPNVVATGGHGVGAVFAATLTGGVITSIVVTNPGIGYQAGDVVTLSINDGAGPGTGAAATISLMPFGVQGNTVEVYVNRVWVGDVRKGFFSAPASVSDFNPSDTAGVFQSNDAFQRYTYVSFKQTNGFLYLLSDSSMNYIGGIQVTGSPAVTIFNNLNVDPQIGTPWPASVQLFSRNIVFANSFGVFVSYGGAVTKISAALDGIYSTVPAAGNTVSGIYPSSASASIFGVAVYMLLLPIINPYTNQQQNKLLLWDGKRWFASSQDVNLTYIAAQEINSVLTAWGTDGTHLYPLFQQGSTGFAKVAQSKLFAQPSFWFNKTAPELSGIINFNAAIGEVDIGIDNELGTGGTVTIQAAASNDLAWFNNSGQQITWTNNLSQVIFWGAPGLGIIGPQVAGQYGVMMGFTVTTSAADVSLLSVSLLEQNYAPRN